MIVKCEQCQTRFKVPDDKVTEKGVKVRCTKCQHTFRVKRDGSIVPVEAQSSDDPFSKFGGSGTAPPSSKTPPPEDPFSRFGPSASAPASRVGSTPTPPPIPSALGNAAAALKNQSGTREFKAMNQTNPKLKKADAAPFDFSALSGPPASGGEARPFDFGNLMPPAPPPQTSTFGRAAPPSSTIQFAGMSSPPPQEEAQPFDFSSLGPPPPAPSAPLSPEPIPEFGDPPPDAAPAPDLDFGLPPPAESQVAPASPALPEIPEPEPDAGPSFGGAKLSSFEGRFDDGPAAPPPTDDGLLGDIPSLSLDAPGGTPDAARGLFFDVPDAPPDEQNQLVAPPSADAPEGAKISIKKGAQLAPAAPAVSTVKPATSKAGKGVVATLWNVVTVMFLLLLVALGIGGALNEGRAATQSVWSRLRTTFASPGDLLAYDVSNGLYDTKVGRPIFYVRGEVKNRSQIELKHVKVKADILDGDELIRSSEAYVGATPSPEDLFGVSSADDLKQIQSRIATGVASVAPGGTSEFLISFYEYPPDLKDFQVRVSVSPDDGAGSKQ